MDKFLNLTAYDKSRFVVRISDINIITEDNNPPSWAKECNTIVIVSSKSYYVQESFDQVIEMIEKNS